MPQVPYNPVPTAEPTSPGEKISVNTPGAAFGENIGAALQHLGATGEQVGNELFQRAIALQDLRNETEARQADADYAEKQGMLHADFTSLKGQQAVDGLQPYLAQSKALRQQYRDSLSSPNAQRMFDSSSLGFLQRNIFNAAGHAGNENKSYIVGEAISAVKNEQHNWVDPTDQNEANTKITKSRADLERAADVDGWGPEKRKLEDQTMVSGTLSGQVMEIARHGNTVEAYERFKDYAGEGLIDQKEHDQVENYIWKWNESLGAKNLVNKVYSPDKSVEKMTNELHAMAGDPKVSLGDPNFQNTLDAALSHKLVFERREILDERHKNEQAIYTAINKGEVSNPQEMQNHPEAGPAFRNLPQSEQNKWMKDVYVKAANRDTQTDLHNLDVLKGMAHDPAQRDDFLNVNLYDKKLKLSNQHVEELVRLRDSLIKQPIDDPHVRQGMQYLLTNHAPELTDLGIIDRSTGRINKGEDLNALRGSLATALNEFKNANQRPPSPEEFEEKIAKPLLKTHAEPAWWGLSSEQVGEYKRAFPQKDIDAAKKELTIDGQPPPTDEETRRWIVRKQWKEFYKGSAGAKDGGPRSAVPD